jgi:DNA primase
MVGRIPQNFIDDVLDRVDIVEVVDRRVSLKKSGRNFTACCPFHDEKTPSFSVNQEKQFYYCFGCGAGGNALGFLMDYERMEFPRAIESLADMAGLEVPREATAFQEEPQQKTNIYKLLEQSADYYSQQLKKHASKQRAVDYLKFRGLTGEIARSFDIGYAPPGWDNLLQALGQNEEDKQLLIDGGMLVQKEEEGKLYDRFRDRIIFPIRDSRGRVIAFGGRVLGDDKPKYLNSPETVVFHKSKELYGLYQARKSNRSLTRILIVEGYMDVVALAQHGITWTAATLGTATSTEHLKRVFRQCPEVIFCFDGDEAGRKAAVKALASALPVMEDGRQARFLFLPQGEDPDTLIREIGKEKFEGLINQATPLETFLIDSQSEGIDTTTLDGRARLSKLAAPLISQLPSGVYKELMWQMLAEKTGLAREQLSSLLEQVPEEARAPSPSEPYHRSPVSSTPKQRMAGFSTSTAHRDPTLYAIALLLHQPRAASTIEVSAAIKSLPGQHTTLLVEILELLHKRPDSTSAMLIGHWYGQPEGETLQRLLQIDQLIPEENIEQELIETINTLKWQYHQDNLDSQVDKIRLKSYSELSDDEKLELKDLLARKHSK